MQTGKKSDNLKLWYSESLCLKYKNQIFSEKSDESEL